MKMDIILANSADPDEILEMLASSEEFHAVSLQNFLFLCLTGLW